MDVEKSFDIPGLVACLDGGNVFSRHSDGMEPGQTRTHSGVLRDQARHERVLENVERFIQVRTGMERRDTGTKANPILRNRWIIHRSDPEPAAAQFMTEAVHSLAVTDHKRHHVSSRVPSIDAEPPELLVEIIGILPQLPAQSRLARSDFEGFQNGGHDHGWKGT